MSGCVSHALPSHIFHCWNEAGGAGEERHGSWSQPTLVPKLRFSCAHQPESEHEIHRSSCTTCVQTGEAARFGCFSRASAGNSVHSPRGFRLRRYQPRQSTATSSGRSREQERRSATGGRIAAASSASVFATHVRLGCTVHPVDEYSLGDFQGMSDWSGERHLGSGSCSIPRAWPRQSVVWQSHASPSKASQRSEWTACRQTGLPPTFLASRRYHPSEESAEDVSLSPPSRSSATGGGMHEGGRGR
eukprot:scaffold240451_cov27-Tisochrysis_lutea.AAC.1